MDLLDDEALLDLRRRARPTDAAAVLDEERRLRQSRVISNLPEPAKAEAPDPKTCAVCKTRPARDNCAQCGQPACAADLWVMLRLCRTCASDEDVERGQRGARPAKRNWLEGRQ